MSIIWCTVLSMRPHAQLTWFPEDPTKTGVGSSFCVAWPKSATFDFDKFQQIFGTSY